MRPREAKRHGWSCGDSAAAGPSPVLPASPSSRESRRVRRSSARTAAAQRRGVRGEGHSVCSEGKVEATTGNEGGAVPPAVVDLTAPVLETGGSRLARRLGLGGVLDGKPGQKRSFPSSLA